jgi:hypothetical protein
MDSSANELLEQCCDKPPVSPPPKAGHPLIAIEKPGEPTQNWKLRLLHGPLRWSRLAYVTAKDQLPAKLTFDAKRIV